MLEGNAVTLPPARPLRIVFVFRAPVGGLFRNVYDVVKELAARGHAVGLICDSTTGGERGERLLGELAPLLGLGVHRLPMARAPGLGDLSILIRISQLLRRLKPDVVHGEGAKGGLYARAAGVFTPSRGPVRCYTPHGGSLNYYPGTPQHRFFMKVEWLLGLATDACLFESRFIQERYEEYVGQPRRLNIIALNGLYDAEYEPVQPNATATDLFYIGEFREAKGLDTLIEALALLAAKGQRPSLTMVGSGPDEAKMRALVSAKGLDAQVSWRGVTPAREAFALGRLMVLPSRFESLPYVILEAAAAQVPVISTDVGGIGEILPKSELIPANSAEALAGAIAAKLTQPCEATRALTAHHAQAIRAHFTIAAMVDTIEGAYFRALALRAQG